VGVDAFKTERFTLDNGLQVILLPIAGSTRVTVTIWYKVGTANDPAGKSGLAHFVEHATVRSVGGHSQQNALPTAASHDDEADAFTAYYDYTAYVHSVPVERLEAVLQTEARRMAKLVITQETLALEREEIHAERRGEGSNLPEMHFDEQMRAVLYGAHPYGVPVLGWPDDVQRLTVLDVDQFYRTWYAPNNAMLIVAGDIPVAQLKSLVYSAYNSILPRVIPRRHRPSLPQQYSGQPLVMKDSQVCEPVWQRMYRAPSYNAENTTQVYALQLLAEILAGEPMGRLYRRLIMQKHLAAEIHVEYLPDSVDVTDLSMRAMIAPGVAVTALEKAIDRELAAVMTTGVTSTEVKEARRRLQSDAALMANHSREVAEKLGIALTTGRTLADVEQWWTRLAAVTAEQVQEAARAVLQADRSVTGVLLPVAANAAACLHPEGP
jgi:zinc protease